MGKHPCAARKVKAAAGDGAREALAAMLTDQAALRVLCEADPEAAVRTFFRLPLKMQRPVLLVVAGLPGGCAGVAALLSVMSPVQACPCAPHPSLELVPCSCPCMPADAHTQKATAPGEAL